MEDPSELPPSKHNANNTSGLYGWSRSYAGFAPEFAEAVLKRCDPDAGQIVIDPFVGSGTSVIASLNYPCSFVGIDLDPFSALLTKAKSVRRISPQSVVDFLDEDFKKDISRFSEEAKSLFSEESLQYASAIFSKLEQRTNKIGHQLWELLLANTNEEYSLELLALASLISSANKSSLTVRGSNPVWYKKSGDDALETSTSLKDGAQTIASQVGLELQEAMAERVPNSSVQVYNSDFSSAPIEDRSIDFMITSPPYLSRLDYVISHLSEITILSGLFPIDLSELRAKMMGTTKMTKNKVENLGLPNVCKDVLHLIQTHQSQASGTYYFRFYSQYFFELYRFMRWSKKIMRPSATGFLVIQDSYYKELRIPVSNILTEMAKMLEINSTSLSSAEQTNSIGGMDPKQRGYAGSKILNETSLQLTF